MWHNTGCKLFLVHLSLFLRSHLLTLENRNPSIHSERPQCRKLCPSVLPRHLNATSALRLDPQKGWLVARADGDCRSRFQMSSIRRLLSPWYHKLTIQESTKSWLQFSPVATCGIVTQWAGFSHLSIVAFSLHCIAFPPRSATLLCCAVETHQV